MIIGECNVLLSYLCYLKLTNHIAVHVDNILTSSEQINSLKREYRSKLEELHRGNSRFETTLDEKQAKIKLLQFQLKTTKADLTESLKKKDVLINSLRSDLDSKGDQLAYLMSKIHNAKVIQMKVGPGEEGTVRYTPTPPPPIRRGSPRPRSRFNSIDFSKTLANDPMTSAAAEILSEQEKTVILSQSVPLPAIGDRGATKSFLSKMKFNRRREAKPLAPTLPAHKAN